MRETEAFGHDARERLAAIVDSSNDGIVSKTLTGTITSWNRSAERIFGYTADEAVGKNISMLFPPERLSEEDVLIAEVAAGRRVEHFETERLRKDGTRIPVSVTLSPIRDASGTIVGVSKIVRDITARKRAEAELAAARDAAEAANRAKDEFLAMLGHELRNPLSPILTALQLMRLRGGDEMVRERTVIERQVTHLIRLVDDLLDVSRITRGKVTLKTDLIEVSRAVAQAVETASPLLEERAHVLELDVPAEGLTVEADADRLAQIFSNLLTNAAKYTPPGGRVRVSARREGGDAVVSVRDTGIGINPDVLPSVFQVFVQGPRALDRSIGGLGLGLTIVRNLVEAHGGTVRAFSEGPDRGSEFVVRLPIAQPRARTAGAAPPAPSARAGGTARRVLVVDDNADAAEMLAAALTLRSLEVRVAHDGPGALEAARDFRPEAAVLDIGLPIMDGYELAERLRQMPGLKGLTLIAVTGYGQESDRQRSSAAGFDHHLVKPVDLEALAQLLADGVGPTAGR